MPTIGKRPEPQEIVPAAPAGAPPAAEPVTDSAVLGLPAVVTIRIPGRNAPGEVRLYVRGTYENHIAYAVEPLDVGRRVLVVTSRGGRAVQVEPTINGS
jgi:hypothetical protein